MRMENKAIKGNTGLRLFHKMQKTARRIGRAVKSLAS